MVTQAPASFAWKNHFVKLILQEDGKLSLERRFFSHTDNSQDLKKTVKMTGTPAANICVPMKVDAFVLNLPVCDGKKSKIAPITQPKSVILLALKDVH